MAAVAVSAFVLGCVCGALFAAWVAFTMEAN